MITPENKAELSALIDRAESEGKWLYCFYPDLWFSPQQLRDANADGRFIWGVKNWNLRDPKEKLAQLENEAKDAANVRDRFSEMIR